MTSEAKSVERDVESLERRVAAIEKQLSTASTEQAIPPEDRGDTLWALTGLQSRLVDDPRSVGGEVMLVGSVTLPDGTPVQWQQGAGTAGMLETEWSDQSAAFAALGHPIRLELLRHILSGVHLTADLAAIDSLGTTGQLHHHLRQLVAAGWVRQTGRGSYEVPTPRVVPLLVCLTGAQR